MLDRMEAGMSAAGALTDVVAGRAHINHRQIPAVDREGRVAIHSGRQVLGIWAEAQGEGCAAGGNLLGDPGVPAAMVAAFAAARGDFGDRLIAVLRAGRDAGGEPRPVLSASLKIADRLTWPWADLRCDWTEEGCLIEAVARAWEVHAPQAAAYVQRATDPTAAPSCGVPGGE